MPRAEYLCIRDIRRKMLYPALSEKHSKVNFFQRTRKTCVFVVAEQF